ncbi:hypothetical protein [Blautia obeum]|uniref:hypothetical protein n=1 Tax=Blautia obeum TaxID=40520 RepID=UPI001D077C9C|nr:hypothetical protein [Blautia obeum]MCB7343344.1 hypothetical protein [Blautia obeum]
MINVSEQLKEESKKNHNYYVTANVTLADGTKLSLEKKDFYLDGNGIIDAADSSDFPIGVAIEKTATLSLVNDKGQFDAYSFNGAVFTIFMNLQLSDRLETFKRGSFIVCRKPAIDGEINLTLLDYMSKADRTYKTNLSFPCTAGEVLRDACRQCGLVMGDADFKNSDFQVQKAPEGTTCRAVIGMAAALAGGNARIDENDLLRIVTFDKEDHVVLMEEIPWPDASGQSILDTEDEEIITVYEKVITGHDLPVVGDAENDVDPIIVTGVKYTDGDEEYLYGTEGYVIDISDNQLLAGNEEEGVSRIGQILEGFELLPFSLSSIPVGYATFGDAIQFKDSRGNLHRSYATDIEFNFADGTEFSCKAKSLETQSLEYPSGTKALVEQTLKKTEEKISAYNARLKQMNDMAANTLGFYYTEVVQPDGSVIAYRHNKLRLSESKIVYKTAADGFFVTSDYQGTDEATTAAGKWTSGFDSNGDAVLNILYALGIQAKWLNTRGFTAEDNDGKVTFRINADTGEVEIDPKSFILGKKNLQEKFSEIDNSIASSRNMTLQLDNEYQSIPAHNDGSIIGEFPSVTTTATVLYNSTDVTEDCSFTVTTSDSVTGSWDKTAHTYTVRSLSAHSGWVSIRVVYLDTMVLTKKFTVAKLYAGDNGRTYYLDCPAAIVKRMADETMSPEELTFSGLYRDGDSVERSAYKSRFKIEETSDGKTWTTAYNSPADGEVSVTWSMTTSGSPKEISAVRCTLYALDGTTVIDYQTVEVVLDAEALTQEQVVNILTNNGAWKGLRYLNGHLYFSFDAARGGTLLLGGENNENGIQKVFDEDGNVIVTADAKGVTLYNKKGTPKARMSKGGMAYFKEYQEDENHIHYKGIVIGDMSDFTEGNRKEYGIKILNYDYTYGDIDISFDGDTQGFTYKSTSGNLEGSLYKLDVAQLNVTEIINAATFKKPPQILNCKNVTAGVHLVFASDGKTLAYLSSSSKRYKDVLEKLQCMEQWYNIQPVRARYKDGYLTEDDPFNGKYMPMFLAEDVEKYMPEAVAYKDGKIEDWNYRVMIPAMFAMLKEQREEIQELKQTVKEMMKC